jgi:hypothetical protein
MKAGTVVASARGGLVTRPGRPPEQGRHQLLDQLLGFTLDRRCGKATAQMPFQYLAPDSVQSPLDGRDLMKQVDAVTVIVGHADHRVEVSPGRAKAESN